MRKGDLVELIAILKEKGNIKKLDLSENYFNEERDLEPLKEILTLTKLDLTGNGIKAEGAKVLGEWLHIEGNQINSLILDENFLREGVRFFEKTGSALKNLSVVACEIAPEAAAQ